jgi:hypothetical protein
MSSSQRTPKRGTAAVIKSGANAGKPWQKTDLFFLVAALARGMSSVLVAGFLGRDEDEVAEKATELRSRRAQSANFVLLMPAIAPITNWNFPPPVVLADHGF